jgi:PilZ domain
LPWFVKENRRAAPRHRYDGNNTWIQLEGSLIRQCQILDLSRTGVRLAVTNAHSLSNTFTLILSKNSSGRPARVKWRRGNEVGAEFFTAKSSSASRLTAGAPRAVKPRGDEGQKSESLMSTPSLPARPQQQDVAKLKADARKVAGSIDSDKTEACCQITDLGGPIVQAAQEKEEKKTQALMQRINEWEKILGPDYPASFNALYEADPSSKDVQEILSVFAMLD